MREDARRGVGWAEDSAFFKANPTRNHRMRLATANEIAVFDSAEGTQAGADGFWWLVVVRQLAPGERAMTRIYAPLPPWPLAKRRNGSRRCVRKQCRVAVMNTFRVGDNVWVESSGQLVFPRPVAITNLVDHHDGTRWAFVEGSSSAYPSTR